MLPGCDEADVEDVSVWDDSADNLARFAAGYFSGDGWHQSVALTASLVHRADNSYNRNAISVALPSSSGGTLDERHLGYLYDDFLTRVGMTNLPDLIEFAGGQVSCTVILDDVDSLGVDLPAPEVLGDAIRDFLAGRGVVASGAPRHRDAPPEQHSHSGSNARTSEVLKRLAGYSRTALEIGEIRIATRADMDTGRRALHLTDRASGRDLGCLDDGWLQLNDERDREAVLACLCATKVPVRTPVTSPSWREDGSWPPGTPPNVSFRRVRGGLDFKIHDSSQESWAIYNFKRDVLWVEDSRLVAPAVHFLHRQGIDVREVGLPRRAWGLDDEIAFESLYDPSDLRPDEELDWGKPRLKLSVRGLLPSSVLSTDTVEWVGAKAPCGNAEPSFDVLERFVKERSSLFPVHSLTGARASCRLCGINAATFTTPISTDVLAYCQRCMSNAIEGLVWDRRRAGIALRELSRLEFDGQPMLPSQLESLHVNPAQPVAADEIDVLLLLRFGVKRRGAAWTMLLEAAGFADDGVRTGWGTLIRARDGHLCLSMRERAVCDFLHLHGIDHEREPLYPADPDYNRHGLRRADWLLGDGTLVELWGLPKDPQYAAKMVEKQLLAQRHGLRLVELVDDDLPSMATIFRPWMSPGVDSPWTWSPQLVAPPRKATKPVMAPVRKGARGVNEFNATAQRERVLRCSLAVDLQRKGLSRAEIGDQLGASAESVKALLRDGKFYLNPTSDQTRLTLAHRAQVAQTELVTRARFQSVEGLTAPRASEAWRDAAVLSDAERETPN